ncbi:hypothetical protein CcaverHIS002_0201250 [Cutaneotrichosporon cavernicola]|uniref:Sorting nexin MVP1 n=1 Tax=Cutaneotrichosporon cavernicola TaxID=279322 RepID=A0AA48IEY6_9TREE|nr:uncharacterized protein CcaverHIS019_0201300 [Cutaneotrichosporon cavernicola]BEI80965.1 hypothetical protein CcaverHIS002_0201250 [Cutaneotrichosporon cavernicola]BEI88768.1 hypothetical protein CcaverHIS019_0201300 [Cutaneotrichosporon cavernicola]BEI96543.1 hypothetical protein CcaverHIS631_0201320 [Cutaneotrichosporon cavernicola]BEJ04315.1 hypothetical protein CcaverHIS641_0201320 [Cutaneotrichosporon cavernicola]
MFNTPRANMQSGGFSDPLASGYDVDPWSGTQSPARGGTPAPNMPRMPSMPSLNSSSLNTSTSTVTNGSGGSGLSQTPNLDALIDDPPEGYITLFRQLESGGAVSQATLHRMVASARLPTPVAEKIISLTDDQSLGRADLYRALALVALAQSDPSSELTLAAVDAALPLPAPRLSVTSDSPAPARPTLPQSPSSTFSPWDTTQHFPPARATYDANGAQNGGNPDAEAERGYWLRLEKVSVELCAQKEGWFLQKYRVSSDKRPDTLSRRYSDFVWLHSTLLHRYPFRLLPALPPKRMNPDSAFLETRRKGLQRFINALVNHPVVRDDGALNVFMTEPNFEAWRKRVKVSTEEESASKRLNPAQEMAIPADLEDKLDGLRTRLPGLVSAYQKMVTLAERELTRRTQGVTEATRFAVVLATVSEDMPAACYRCVPGGKCCDVCQGTGRGLATVGYTWSRLAEQRERELSNLSDGIEALKRQRDLYMAFRDLFHRHERLSRDGVDSLQKRVVSRQSKIEGLRAATKPGWEDEVGKLTNGIEQDNSAITALLARRVFVRACMWHELGVVFHSRQAAQATLGWRAWVGAESNAVRSEGRVWDRLGEDLEDMPLE